MGISITCHVQKLAEGVWTTLELADEVHPLPPHTSDSDFFAFLGGPNDPGRGKPQSPFPRRGLPPDSPEAWLEMERLNAEGLVAFSGSWLLISELLDFDYDTEFEDRTRRAGTCIDTLASHSGQMSQGSVVKRNRTGWIHGGYLEPYPVGKGVRTTWRKYLGPNLACYLGSLRAFEPAKEFRLVFWFDY